MQHGDTGTKKGYILAIVRVREATTFEPFFARSEAAIKQHGGRVVVRTDEPDCREGHVTCDGEQRWALSGLNLIVAFETLSAARACYESAELDGNFLKGLRDKCAESDVCLVEGNGGEAVDDEDATESGYVLIHAQSERARVFAAKPRPAVAQYGGCVLAASADVDVREGEGLGNVAALFVFDSAKSARTFVWSPEFSDSREVR